jgi:predicted enzyme related to lactoylglutathione lyase
MAVRDHYPHGQFCWVDLVSRDMSEAREFYRRLFGWQSTDLDTQGGPPYAHFELAGRSVAGLGQMTQEMLNKKLPAMWNSYVHVDDIQAVCAKVTQLGGTITVPVMKILDAGSRAFIRDPTGAQVGLWQKDQHYGAALHQDFHCFCWNELCTRDVDRAADFFGQLLDWEFAEYPSLLGKYYVIRNRGEECSGLLQIDHRWGEMPPCWLVYFAVQSVDITVDQLRQLGGYVLVHPFDIQEGRLAVVADGQGAMFDLVQMNDEPAS